MKQTPEISRAYVISDAERRLVTLNIDISFLRRRDIRKIDTEAILLLYVATRNSEASIVYNKIVHKVYSAEMIDRLRVVSLMQLCTEI